MRTATYISDNGIIACFSTITPLLLENLKSDLGATAQVDKFPRQDGAKTYQVNLNPKTINLVGSIVAYGNYRMGIDTAFDEYMNFLDMCFVPNQFGTLIYQDNTGGKIIRCRPIAKPTYSNMINRQSVTVDIEFFADSAYWESYNLYEKDLSSLTRKWIFPFTLPLTFGEYRNTVTIDNPTKFEISPIIEVYSRSEFIRISNATLGQEIEITRAIDEGQKMVINSKDFSVGLYENGVFVQDATNWITASSEFITLAPGKNELKVSNETQDGTPTAKIFYRLPMLGV